MQRVIIGIHGLANKPPLAVEAAGWKAALQEGLRRNHGDARDFDFDMCYWADLRYNPLIDPAADAEPYRPAGGMGPLPEYRGSLFGSLITGLLDGPGSWLDRWQETIGLDGAAQAVIARKLQDLGAYYNDAEQREALKSRLVLAINRHRGKRIMLVAHSMGTIISYDVLRELGREDAAFRVDHFVTLGSPLGMPPVWAKARASGQDPRTPSAVARWTNYADRRDPVAVDPQLANDYAPNAAGVGVRDHFILNGYQGLGGDSNHHKIYGYLRAPEVSGAVHEFI